MPLLSFIDFHSGQNMLYPKELAVILLDGLRNEWIFYWLIALTSILIIGKLSFERRFNLSIAAQFVNRNFSTLLSESSLLKHPLNLILSFIFLITSGFFISYFALHFAHQEQWNQTTSLELMVAVLVFFLFKSVLVSLSQFLFEMQSVIGIYLNVVVLSQNIMAIIMLVSLWLMAYISPELGLYLGSIIMIVLWLLRLYKITTQILPKINYRLFHFIIYLCTVEILPLIIAVKLYFLWLSMS